MKAVLGSPLVAFQLFAISGPKLNSAMNSSSNSSTSSSTMVKVSNADLLAGVKIKSFIVFTTSARPDSAMQDANNIDCELTHTIYIHSQDLTCHLSIAIMCVSMIIGNNLFNGCIKGKTWEMKYTGLEVLRFRFTRKHQSDIASEMNKAMSLTFLFGFSP